MKLRSMIATAAMLMALPAYSITLNSKDMTSSLSIIKGENQSYEVKLCESTKNIKETICATDTINMKIIETRLDDKISSINEIFSSEEKIAEIKNQMKNEINETGSSELTLMPGATLKANQVGMLDWLFEMAVKSALQLEGQRDNILRKSEQLLEQVDGVQGQTMTVSNRIFEDKAQELIESLHIELE